MSRFGTLALALFFLASPALADGPTAQVATDSEACASLAGGVCLGDGRFLVEVSWLSDPLADAAEAMRLGSDAVYFRSPAGAGLVVQVVDGRAVNRHFWVLSAATAAAGYSLGVTDLTTGERRSYSELGGAGGTRDLLAFPAVGDELTRTGSHDSGVILDSGRPRVEARSAGSSDFIAGEQLAPETTIFRAVGASDPDLVVSVLDGRDIDGQWWVLSISPGGQGWDFVLNDSDNGERHHLNHAAVAGDTQLLAVAPAGETSVAVTLDKPRAVKKTITVAGGVIRARSANGTKFTLTIPAKALLSSQAITLTPIKSIQGLPFKSGLAGGVEIGPAGLRLAVTASLLIVPAQPVALAKETTFGYRAHGAQFFLYPALLTGRPVVLPVIHTGGYGLARGTAAEQAAQLSRPPPRAEDRFDQKLWKLHAQRRRLLDQRAGDSAIPSVEAAPAADVSLTAFYQDVFNNQLRNLLVQIAGGCAGRKKWGPYAESFIAKAAADGVAAGLAAETAQLRNALNHGTAACYNQAGRACLVDKDSKFAIPMLVYWRQLVFAERTDLVNPDKLQSCLTFRFEFDTLVDHDSGHSPGSFASAAHHRVDTKNHIIRWRPPFVYGTGDVATPNNYLEATWTAGPQPMNCVITGTGRVKPGALKVLFMGFQGVNSFEETPPLPKMDLVYNPGLLEMEIVQTCPPAAPVKYFQPLFTMAYYVPHVNEITNYSLIPPLFPQFEFEVLDWQMKLGALYALRAYQRTVHIETVTISEVTTLYVYHKPGS